jgi:FtsP/CotA-like multicopper oxidase with cupredoxin domain
MKIKKRYECPWIAGAAVMFALCGPRLPAQPTAIEVCPRPLPGSIVENPQDLPSQNGVLEAELIANNSVEADGAVRYCYSDAAGHESPTLRVKPGDLVILRLKNALVDPDSKGAPSSSKSGAIGHAHDHSHQGTAMSNDPCAAGTMSAVSVNLHFHGRCDENVGAAGRCAVRISISHS